MRLTKNDEVHVRGGLVPHLRDQQNVLLEIFWTIQKEARKLAGGRMKKHREVYLRGS